MYPRYTKISTPITNKWYLYLSKKLSSFGDSSFSSDSGSLGSGSGSDSGSGSLVSWDSLGFVGRTLSSVVSIIY